MQRNLFPPINKGIKQTIFQKSDGEYILFVRTPAPNKDYYLSMGDQVYNVHQYMKGQGDDPTGVSFGKVGMNSSYILFFAEGFDPVASLELDGQKEPLTCIDPAQHAALGFPQDGKHVQQLINATLSMSEADKNKEHAYWPKFRLL